MSDLKTFPQGGVHPSDHKLSSQKKTLILNLPKVVKIPLSQHLGAPAIAMVKKGDQVKVGTLLAKSGGFISANIHSSVSGTVAMISESTDTSGYLKEMVVINVEGDEWEENIDRSTDLRNCKYSRRNN